MGDEMRTLVERLTDKIAGEIVFSDDPGRVMRKWRGIFGVTQMEIARTIGVSPSVISDYECGRRVPGVQFVRKFINALINLDERRNFETVGKFRDLLGLNFGAILDIAEYASGVDVERFCDAIEGEIIGKVEERKIYGHTIVDSIRAILSMNAFDFYRLYGFTSERAIVFTAVTTGRSPMVAVRVSNLKPSAVVLHGMRADDVDAIAKKIAEIERISLIATLKDVDEVIASLRRFA